MRKFCLWLGLENHKDGGKVYYDYTDSSGRYVLDGKTTGLVRYWFVKDGYYQSEGELHLEGAEDKQNVVREEAAKGLRLRTCSCERGGDCSRRIGKPAALAAWGNYRQDYGIICA